MFWGGGRTLRDAHVLIKALTVALLLLNFLDFGSETSVTLSVGNRERQERRIIFPSSWWKWQTSKWVTKTEVISRIIKGHVLLNASVLEPVGRHPDARRHP